MPPFHVETCILHSLKANFSNLPHASGSSGSSAPDSVPSFHKRLFVLDVMIPCKIYENALTDFSSLKFKTPPPTSRWCHVVPIKPKTSAHTSWESLHHLQHRPASPVLVLQQCRLQVYRVKLEHFILGNGWKWLCGKPWTSEKNLVQNSPPVLDLSDDLPSIAMDPSMASPFTMVSSVKTQRHVSGDGIPQWTSFDAGFEALKNLTS